MSKNNRKWYEEKSGVKKLKYGIRKVSFGAASVVIGASIFLPSGIASAESIANTNKDVEITETLDSSSISSSGVLKDTTEDTTNEEESELNENTDSSTTNSSSVLEETTGNTAESVLRRAKRDVAAQSTIDVTIPYSSAEEARKFYNSPTDSRISKSIVLYAGEDVDLSIEATSTSNDQIKNLALKWLASSGVTDANTTSLFGLNVDRIANTPTNNPAAIRISGTVQAPAQFKGQNQYGYSHVIQAEDVNGIQSPGYNNPDGNNRDYIFILLGRLSDKIVPNQDSIEKVAVEDGVALTTEQKEQVKENVKKVLKEAGMKDIQ